MNKNQSTQSIKAIELLHKFKDNKEPIQLIKSELYFCNISVYKIGNSYIEVTQDSSGRYNLYEMSEKELIKYFNSPDIDGMILSEDCPKAGEPCELLKSEDLKEK